MREKQYVRYRRGIGSDRVLLEGPHVVAPHKEFWVDEIIRQASCRAGCHLLAATRSRAVADLDRPADFDSDGVDPGVQERAVEEYRTTVAELIERTDLLDGGSGLTRPFLHLSVHGMKNREDADLVLGTGDGTACGPEVEEWLTERIGAWIESGVAGDARLARNERSSDSSALAHHRRGDGAAYPGFGDRFHSARLEIAHWMRADPDSRDELTFLLAEIAGAFHGTFRAEAAP